MGTCNFCGAPAKLCRSHVLSEFLYQDSYNDKRQLAAIHGRNSKGWVPLQKGLYENLFCEACEAFFNTNYEQPYNTLSKSSFALPERQHPKDEATFDTDSRLVKAFGLLNLYRAAVACSPTFERVNLGRHQERIRKMLSAAGEFPSSAYPIQLAFVANDAAGRGFSFLPMVVFWLRGRLRGHTLYSGVFGRLYWRILVSNHRCPDFESRSIPDTGLLRIPTIKASQVPGVVLSGEALRNAKGS